MTIPETPRAPKRLPASRRGFVGHDERLIALVAAVMLVSISIPLFSRALHILDGKGIHPGIIGHVLLFIGSIMAGALVIAAVVALFFLLGWLFEKCNLQKKQGR